MRLHQTPMTCMVVGVLSLMLAPAFSYAQRGESDSERGYTVEGINCKLFPEDCEQGGRTRGLPQRPTQDRPTVEPPGPGPITFHIRFATNSDTIPPRYHEGLDKLGQAISKSLPSHPQARIEIAGHTDSVGSQEYNRRLSEKRAESVKRYLMDKFNIPADNLSVKGYGPDSPVDSNDTLEGRERNRRVEAGRVR